ncbi:D-aminoacyl-tRNA deacylase [Luteibaculum oceani]|uniref:D-aminoacyl-tRNA deacylase n=1 Tax=Luteibaculum oceani TaxID=1294296 RepID=A0A5C6V4W2_9FLAO|nr:D-aminoacyl-tRNA deacylase [Luteibaculum oceani]TXC78828.1 D-tyrosyl-tRNA(Tyr) deacylase [Luteibaculum oceani]
MRVVLQRVNHASVQVNGKAIGVIAKGLLLLVGIEDADTIEDLEWMAKKVAGMRIFSDDEGKMNLSVQDISGEVLVVSQFTLHASTKKGNRPSFIKAGKPDFAASMISDFQNILSVKYQLPIQTGEFGADMKVTLENDGPVTIVIDSKNKE